MGFEEVFVLQIAPVLGVIFTELLYLGPMYAILQARKKRDLGSLNPVLFAVTAPQALQWTVYGAMIGNVYIALGSIAGIIVGLFYLVTCARLCRSETQVRRMETIFIVQFSITAALATMGFFAPEAGAEAAGLYSMLSSLALYTTPLLDMRRIVAARDASSINRGFLCMQIASGFLWTVYSIFDFDVFVLTPSLVGFVFGLVQLTLVLLFRGTSTLTPEMSKDVEAFGVPENESSASATMASDEALGGCYSPPMCYRLNREESAPLQPLPTATPGLATSVISHAIEQSSNAVMPGIAESAPAPTPQSMTIEVPAMSMTVSTALSPPPMAAFPEDRIVEHPTLATPVEAGEQTSGAAVVAEASPVHQGMLSSGPVPPFMTLGGRQRVLQRAASSHVTPSNTFAAVVSPVASRRSDLGSAGPTMAARPRAMTLSPLASRGIAPGPLFSEGFGNASNMTTTTNAPEPAYQIARVATPGLDCDAPQAVAISTSADDVFAGAAESTLPALSSALAGQEASEVDDEDAAVEAKAFPSSSDISFR